MTTTVDLVALAAAGQTKVTLLGGTITSLGSTGTDYAGFDDADAVYVEAKVQLRDNSRGAAQLVLLLEGSDDGNSWSTLETFTFTNNGTQTATVSTPNDHLRVTWTVARNTEWFIDHVTVAPASLNAPGGGGTSIVSCLLACDAGVDIHTQAQHEIFWDALYTNAVDFGALLAIPTGLGLTFAFDESDATITTTEAGTWSFAYNIWRNADATWEGQLLLAALDRNHQLASGITSGGIKDVKTDVLTLPSGTALVPIIDTQTTSTGNPLTSVVYLSIVRLG